MFKVRNLRPELSASVMKSTDHTWLAATASGSGWRTVLRFRPRFRRSDSFSSTYSRYTRLWFTCHPSRCIAKVASLVAIVIGGYGFAHGEPGAKKALAGVAAGTGIAVMAVNVLSWLWGV
jgi:hypothetical protein